VHCFFPHRRLLNALVLCVITIGGAGCATLAAPNAPQAALSDPTTPTPAAVLPTTVANEALLAPTTAVSPTQDVPPTLPILPTVTPIPPSAEPTAVPPTIPPTAEPTAVPPTAVPTALLPTTAPALPPVPDGQIEPFDPALAAELQQILDRLVNDGFIPGAALSVHVPGYEPWTGASGFVDQQHSQPIQISTHVRIASISKVFTAVVVLQLVEEGRLDLDTPVSAWFPQLVPHADAVTVRRLLNHTTGLYDYLEDKHYLGQAFGAPDREWSPEELVAYAALQPPLFLPGAPNAWDYSSTNYVILGMIVEQVTGRSLAQEMRTRIIDPLELRNTFFAPDEPVPGEVARGYRFEYDFTDLSLSFAFATANMVSTTDDVRRFGEALFGGQLLAPETMAAMYTFENGKGQYYMPALEYGLGLMRNRLPVGPDAAGQVRPPSASTVIGHTGGFGGFRTALWHAPEGSITLALAMNQGGTDPNILATQVFEAVLRGQGR
jgi:D-alanyl-D-alanine carboxypeptidase